MMATKADSPAGSKPSTRDCFDAHEAPGSRFITKYENYFGIYDRYLEPLRDRPITMIEIGVQHGGSLQMWKEYLHPDSTVVGIDIYAACKKYEADGIRVFIGDQSDPKFLASVITEIGTVDYILDDGSHIPRHQNASFEYLFHHGLKDGGVYICEDCHTSYWPRYGGGVRKSGTFIEFAKVIADDINYWHMEDKPGAPNWRTQMVESVEFYSSVVAFRKAQMRSPRQIEVGDVKALDLEAPFREGALGKLVVFAKRVPFLQGAVRRTPFLWNIMKKLMNTG